LQVQGLKETRQNESFRHSGQTYPTKEEAQQARQEMKGNGIQLVKEQLKQMTESNKNNAEGWQKDKDVIDQLKEEDRQKGHKLRSMKAYSEILEGAADTAEAELTNALRKGKRTKDCNTLLLCVLAVVGVLLATGVLVIQFK
jgi:hypothetical protein